MIRHVTFGYLISMMSSCLHEQAEQWRRRKKRDLVQR